MTGGGLQLQWQQFMSDTTKWWEDEKLCCPGFSHKKSKDALCSNNSYKPCWVNSQLGVWVAHVDAGMRGPSGTISTQRSGRVGKYVGNMEVGMCRNLCEDGQLIESVDALNLLVQRACYIPRKLYYRVLKRCIAQKDVILGRRLHGLTVQSGYEGNAFLATHLIRLYALYGRLEEAMGVFSKVTPPSAYNWASIIWACARHGQSTQAIALYRQMSDSSVQPDNCIFVAVLKACARAGDLAVGKSVHARIRDSAVEPDIFVQTGLVTMYAKCGSLEDSRRVFDRLSERDVVTWNAMIAGYAQQGMGHKALSLYRAMQQEGITQPDSITFVCLLQSCASVASLPLGKQLHAQIEERGWQTDVVVGASLINMYAKCGSLEDAQRVFDKLTQKDVVTWNALIAGYAHQGMAQEAFSLYNSMLQQGIVAPDCVTFVCLLHACASVAALPMGKHLHAQLEARGLQSHLVVGNSLVTMYAKCGNLEEAQRVFDGLPEKNVVTWNSMIAGYVWQGMGHEALSLYRSMQEEGITAGNSVTFVCLLQACASVAALPLGKQLHLQIEERGLRVDVVVGASLVNMYAKCGSLEDAQGVFDGLSQKDTVTWNSMIAGYAQHGMGHEAFSLYSSMQQEGVTPPDSVTFVCLMQACGSIASLSQAKQLHAHIEEQGLQADVVVGASLVNMYAKCGCLERAQQVFDSLPQRVIVTWGALVAGYACQGDSKTVFDLVDRMRQEGIQPDGITFLSVLTVCSHVGLVDKGQQYFKEMCTYYGITPTIEHYTCMMDLLGRAGHLDEALQMVQTMPFQPNGAVWSTLLGACRKWSNIEVGREAFECAVRLDEKDSAAYVLMSDIYVGAQMWEEAREMQGRRVKCGARKEPGQSWTDMGRVVHKFLRVKVISIRMAPAG